MTITEIAVKRPTLVVVIFTALTLLGMACYGLLNYDLIPKLDLPMISISTQYPGASANEVENSVTKKLEDALSSLENVSSMTSTSQEGLASIMIELAANTDVNKSLQDAQRKVNAVLFQLPAGAKTPSLMNFSSTDMPILKMGVSAKVEATKLYQIAKEQIKPQISKVNGVGQVTLVGGDEREIKINVDRDKLKAFSMTINQIYSAVNNANQQFATGRIEGTKSQYTVRLSGKVSSLDQLRQIVVSKRSDGATIRLSDLAEIVDGIAEYSTINRINGENSVGIQVQKQSDANSVRVCELVKAELGQIEQQYASIGLKFNIAADNSVFTLASARAVMEDLGIANILVALVMFLFLHSLRNSFIVLVSIPTSLISVFTGMYIFNFSLNMMTLMGLSLVIGILVDDSIVVLENIYRHLSMGKDRHNAALEGRSEIGFTAVAITMVDVVVFLPMALVSGMIGNMLKEFSLVVVFSTLMSLFVSFTVTPLLASRMGKIEKLTRDTLMGRVALGFEQGYRKLVEFYERILRWGLAHRKTVYAGAIFLFVMAFALLVLRFIGSEFMPNSDRGEFVVSLEGEPQISLYQTNMLVEKVEKLLFNKREVVKIFSNVGYSSSMMGTGNSESHKSELTVTIVDKNSRTQSVEQYAAMVKRDILTAIPGLKVTSTPSSMMGSMDAPIQILLRGPDMNEIYAVADSVIAVIKDVPGINDIRLSVDKSKPELHVELNRDKMSLLGLSVADVGSTLQLALAGNTDLQYSEGGSDYNINIKLDQFDRKSINDLGSVGFVNSRGDLVELRQFADISQTLGPNKLERYDRMSSLTIKSEVYGRPTGTVGEESKAFVSQKVHPRSVDIEYKGQMERQAEGFGGLLTALFAAILLVYFVMVSLYNSYVYPFVVLFSLPVAMIGALMALALTGNNLSIYSLIGMIMLMGLVAKNAILLIDFTNSLRERGMEVVEALVEAGKERMRPILMTTIAMVFGMLPLAISSGAASENRNGLAWVIIGGLISSLLLTLVLVPSVYVTVDRVKSRFYSRLSRNKP